MPGKDPLKLFPPNIALGTTTTQPILPSFSRLIQYKLKASVVTPNTKILIVPPKLCAQHTILFFQWFMAIVPAPPPDSANSSFQSFPCRLPLNNPVPTTRFPPVVGKSEKIECAVPTSSLILSVWLPEVHQRRLLWMNGQIEAIKPLRKNFHDLSGIFFPFAANNEVSSPGESHPQALSEPDVNLSAHPAPIIRSLGESPFSSE
jgi:hypothetical protein